MMLVGSAVSITYTPTCRFVVPVSQCGERAVAVVAYACRHEHVVRLDLCDEHAEHDIALGDARVIRCQECLDAEHGFAHSCTVDVRREPLPEPKPTPLSGPVYFEPLS